MLFHGLKVVVLAQEKWDYIIQHERLYQRRSTLAYIITTCLPHHKNSNNQRIGSVSDNDRRFKGFCSNTVLCVSFMWQMVMTFYPLKEGKKSYAWSHCVWYIPFLLSGSPKDCWLHTTWRLGLLAPLVARNYLYISAFPKTQTSLNLITNRVHHKKTWICFLLP